MTTLAHKQTDSPTLATKHSEMRQRAHAALETHNEGLAINQQAVDNALTNRQTFTSALETIQARRAVLLAELKTAQSAAAQSLTAQMLAQGTPVEDERTELLEQARGKVSGIMNAIQELAGHAEETESRQAKNDYALEDAEEQRNRAQESVTGAQSIYDEVDILHRDELTAQVLEELATARFDRETARGQIAKSEQKCSQVQEKLAEVLAEWPQHLTATLQEFGEFAEAPLESVLSKWREIILLLEEHAATIDEGMFRAFCVPSRIPIFEFARMGTRATAYRPNTPEELKDPVYRNFAANLDGLDKQIAALRKQSRRQQAESIAHNT